MSTIQELLNVRECEIEEKQVRIQEGVNNRVTSANCSDWVQSKKYSKNKKGVAEYKTLVSLASRLNLGEPIREASYIPSKGEKKALCLKQSSKLVSYLLFDIGPLKRSQIVVFLLHYLEFKFRQVTTIQTQSFNKRGIVRRVSDILNILSGSGLVTKNDDKTWELVQTKETIGKMIDSDSYDHYRLEMYEFVGSLYNPKGQLDHRH